MEPRVHFFRRSARNHRSRSSWSLASTSPTSTTSTSTHACLSRPPWSLASILLVHHGPSIEIFMEPRIHSPSPPPTPSAEAAVEIFMESRIHFANRRARCRWRVRSRDLHGVSHPFRPRGRPLDVEIFMESRIHFSRRALEMLARTRGGLEIFMEPRIHFSVRHFTSPLHDEPPVEIFMESRIHFPNLSASSLRDLHGVSHPLVIAVTPPRSARALPRSPRAARGTRPPSRIRTRGSSARLW
jgi:hypothetical protein